MAKNKMAWTADGSDITPLAQRVMDVVDQFVGADGDSWGEDSNWQNMVDRIKDGISSFVMDITQADVDVLEDYNYHIGNSAIAQLRSDEFGAYDQAKIGKTAQTLPAVNIGDRVEFGSPFVDSVTGVPAPNESGTVRKIDEPDYDPDILDSDQRQIGIEFDGRPGIVWMPEFSHYRVAQTELSVGQSVITPSGEGVIDSVDGSHVYVRYEDGSTWGWNVAEVAPVEAEDATVVAQWQVPTNISPNSIPADPGMPMTEDTQFGALSQDESEALLQEYNYTCPQCEGLLISGWSGEVRCDDCDFVVAKTAQSGWVVPLAFACPRCGAPGSIMSQGQTVWCENCLTRWETADAFNNEFSAAFHEAQAQPEAHIYYTKDFWWQDWETKKWRDSKNYDVTLDHPLLEDYYYVGMIFSDHPERVWQTMNIGDHGGYSVRSMSVGDVVVINGKAYIAQDMGFGDAPWFQTLVTAQLSGGYRVLAHGIGESVWSGNGMTYDTFEAAYEAALDLASRWFGADDFKIVPAGEDANSPYEGRPEGYSFWIDKQKDDGKTAQFAGDEFGDEDATSGLYERLDNQAPTCSYCDGEGYINQNEYDAGQLCPSCLGTGVEYGEDEDDDRIARQRRFATGEMSQDEAENSDEWQFWRDVVDYLGGNAAIHAFDVYQGPYITYSGHKFWLGAESVVGDYVYDETNDRVMYTVPDVFGAVEAIQELLNGGGEPNPERTAGKKKRKGCGGKTAQITMNEGTGFYDNLEVGDYVTVQTSEMDGFQWGGTIIWTDGNLVRVEVEDVPQDQDPYTLGFDEVTGGMGDYIVTGDVSMIVGADRVGKVSKIDVTDKNLYYTPPCMKCETGVMLPVDDAGIPVESYEDPEFFGFECDECGEFVGADEVIKSAQQRSAQVIEEIECENCGGVDVEIVEPSLDGGYIYDCLECGHNGIAYVDDEWITQDADEYFLTTPGYNPVRAQVEGLPNPAGKECPNCHSTQTAWVDVDEYGDVYLCESCDTEFGVDVSPYERMPDEDWYRD